MMMMKVEAFFLGTWLKEGGMLRTLMRIRSHCTLQKLVHFKKGAHANDESLTKVVDFW